MPPVTPLLVKEAVSQLAVLGAAGLFAEEAED